MPIYPAKIVGAHRMAKIMARCKIPLYTDVTVRDNVPEGSSYAAGEHGVISCIWEEGKAYDVELYHPFRVILLRADEIKVH